MLDNQVERNVYTEIKLIKAYYTSMQGRIEYRSDDMRLLFRRDVQFSDKVVLGQNGEARRVTSPTLILNSQTCILSDLVCMYFLQ